MKPSARSLLTLLAFFVVATLAEVSGGALGRDQSAEAPAESEQEPGDPGWPRVVESGDLTLTIYQPQVEEFTDAILKARAAVAVESRDSKEPNYGVIWIRANVDVDKERGLVDLSDIEITKASFPGAPDRQDEFLKIIRDNTEASRTISLARIEANLAMTVSEKAGRRVPVKNDPPKIFYSTTPALLVLIDGAPALRPVEGAASLQRVINTRALILFDRAANRYELTVMGRWFSAANVQGPWSLESSPPRAAEALRQSLASQDDPQVDLLEDPGEDVKKAFELGTPPTIYVSTEPAELLVTQGKPQMQPIPGTQLLWVQNTTNDIFFDVSAQTYYVPLSGRWFRARSLAGPWEFVQNDRLPSDFAKVPEKHPKGTVLATVGGTPQAKEAAIADTIPQTAQVNRSEATLETRYDGDPEWEDIPETPLAYARNCPTPVIRVEPSLYYAVDAGVWYTSSFPGGSWAVAAEIPAVIYAIPPACPIYYVTYVRVYRWTPDYVWVGYTPGYLGACLAPWGTVVYGTGWYYPPWIGSVWLGAPWTWGFGVSVGWDWTGGWVIGFGRPYWRPWWGPAGWGWGRPRPPRPFRGPGRRPVINHINVYNRLPSRAVVVRPQRPGVIGRPGPERLPGRPGAETRTGTALRPGERARPPVGRPAPDIYAGRDGNVYRPGRQGWEQNDGRGWRSLPPGPAAPRPDGGVVTRPSPSDLSRERQAREGGNARAAPRPPSPPSRPAPPSKK